MQGISSIKYSVNNLDNFVPYTGTFTITGGGNTTVYAYAEDNAANRSQAFSRVLLAPTASTASISGKISHARASERVSITLTRLATGESKTIKPNQLGYYKFENLPVGEDYVLSPAAGGYEFDPQNRLISLLDDISNADFQALVQGRQSWKKKK